MHYCVVSSSAFSFYFYFYFYLLLFWFLVFDFGFWFWFGVGFGVCSGRPVVVIYEYEEYNGPDLNLNTYLSRPMHCNCTAPHWGGGWG